MYHREPEWKFCRWVCGCPNVGRIGVEKVRGGAHKGVTGVGGTNYVVSGAASGDRYTGMLERIANGDGELEGTEHELSAFDISLDLVSFY